MMANSGWVRRSKLVYAIAMSVVLQSGWSATAKAAPTADPPEEVLRTEIIVEARSPIDGKPLTPADYAKIQAEEQAKYEPPPQVPRKVRGLVSLLKLRKFIKTYLPIIPIK